MIKTINDLLLDSREKNDIEICGWVKTKRASRNICFIMINDGSTLNDLQCVINVDELGTNISDSINTGASVKINGNLINSKGNEQNLELKVKSIDIIGGSINYPIQPKNHSLEFLRDISHLRFRTRTFYSVFKIRSTISYAIHKFFRDNNFIYLNTPILTSNDAEGAGEMFTVTSLDLLNNKNIDFKDDFFGQKVNLTVSGQLEAETGIFGLNRVYTFGPTFRAENSNTTRHLAEFWMVEPEMAFFDLEADIMLAENFVKYIITSVLDQCRPELEFLNALCVKKDNYSLIDKLTNTVNEKFEQISYTEAINILSNCKKNSEFRYTVTGWGIDLQTEHERYLTELYFKKPVIITDYPKDIKAFYMRLNDDNKTVAAMDVLFPGIGEVIGGSQREERLDYLMNAIKEKSINPDYLKWYLETRQFGTIIHSGFGMGLERIVQFITGMDNIRDTIPFPRFPNHCEF